MYKIGDRVRVVSDNQYYDAFRDKLLVVVSIATNTEGHPAYDEGMNGMQLMDLKVADSGDLIPCSLYEYEITLSLT